MSHIKVENILSHRQTEISLEMEQWPTEKTDNPTNDLSYIHWPNFCLSEFLEIFRHFELYLRLYQSFAHQNGQRTMKNRLKFHYFLFQPITIFSLLKLKWRKKGMRTRQDKRPKRKMERPKILKCEHRHPWFYSPLVYIATHTHTHHINKKIPQYLLYFILSIKSRDVTCDEGKVRIFFFFSFSFLRKCLKEPVRLSEWVSDFGCTLSSIL